MKMKKLAAFAMSAVMLVSGFSVAFAETSANAMVLEAEEVTANLDDETVEVEISATANPGYVNGLVDIGWDETALVLKDIEFTTVAPDNGCQRDEDTEEILVTTPGEYTIAFGKDTWTKDRTTTGTFFTLIFEPAETAKAGKYDITIAPGQDKDAILNAAEEEVPFEGVNGSVTFEGEPIVQSFTITFDAGEGTVNPTSAQTNAEGKLESLPTPKNGDAEFLGWFTAEDGGDKVTTDTVFESDTTIYAQYEETAVSVFTITFDAGEGTVRPTSAQTNEEGKLSSLPTPKNGDAEFLGWFTAEDGGDKVTTDTVFESDTTIYAQYKAAVYAITTENCVAYEIKDDGQTAITTEALAGAHLEFDYDGSEFDPDTQTIEWTVDPKVKWEYGEDDDPSVILLNMPNKQLSVKAAVVDKPVPFEAVKGGSYTFQAVVNGKGIVTIKGEDNVAAIVNTLRLAKEQKKISVIELGPVAGIARYNEDSFPLPEYIIQEVREEKTNNNTGDGSGSGDPSQEPSEYSTKIEIIRTPFAKDLEIKVDTDEYTWDDIEEKDIFEWSEEDTIPYFASLKFSAGTIARNYTVDLTKGSAKLSGEDALRSAVFMIATALAYDGYEKDENGSYIYEDQLENGFFWVDIDKDEETIDLYINLDDDAKGTYDICIDITAVVEYVKEQIKGKSMREVDFFEIYANLPLTVEKTDECSVKDKAVLNFPKEVNKELLAEVVEFIVGIFTDGSSVPDSSYEQYSALVSEYADTALPYVKDFSFNTMTFVFKNDSTPSGGGGGRSGSVSFTLTYETNGGETIKAESHKAGDNVTLDKTPVKDGYTFTGWYADKECTQKIESITMNSSKTVYAGWSNGAEVVDENAPLLVVTINETKYQLKGRNMEMDSAPFIDANDRTMLPVRVVANALGISDNDIAWDNTTKTACFTRPDGKVVACTVGSNIIKIGDEEVEIDTAPVIRNDRIYLPMRALFNAFNVSDDHIAWDGAARKVTVAKEALDDINALTEVAPVEEEPVEEVPAEETPAAETPAEETPAEETPAEEA